MNTPCPNSDELTRYLAGNTSDSRFERLDEHIAGCVTCQTELEHLASLSEPLCQLVAEAVQATAPRLPTDLRTALEQIRQHKPRHQPWGSEVGTPANADELVQIREYRILSCIGEGGMGCVYHAYDTFLQRPVAIKVLRRERLHKKEALQRFMREMEVVGNLVHPSIVKALAAGEQDGLHYLVMEYIPGVDTYQLRRNLGALSIADSCEIILQAARALDYAHSQQVLHRDIKSSNLIVNSDGKVVLLDLGLAQFFGTSSDTKISKTDQAIGTLTYMAPEQLAGLRGHSIEADIYSLGATLCEYLSGQKLPLRNAENDILAMIGSTLPKLPTELSQLIRAMTENSPKDRPKSMRDVVMRISNFTRGSNLRVLVEQYQNRMLLAATRETPEAVILPPIQSDATTDNPRLEQVTPSDRHVQLSGNHVLAQQQNERAGRQSQRVLRRRRAGLAAAAVLLVSLPPIIYSLSPWGPLSPLVFAPSHEPAQDSRLKRAVASNTPLIAAAPVKGNTEPVTGNQEPHPIFVAGTNTANGNPQDEADDVKTGSLEIVAVDDIPRQLLRDGRVQVEKLDDQSRFTLESGFNELPLGKYRIVMDGPEEMETIEEVYIANGAARRLNLTAVLRKPFQYPKIPDQVGAHCTYHGKIQLLGGAMGEGTSYTLRLKLLASEVDSNTGVSSKWLQVEAVTQHASGDLIESGYLKIDSEKWEDDKNLKVIEGWVVASSNSIAQYMQDFYPNSGTKDLVVPFDPKEDLLKTRASSVLPRTRISLHDFLVLFFGDESLLAADDRIKKLRPELPTMGKRHSWIDTIDAGRGPVECYVVSSQDRTKQFTEKSMGFFMARNKRALFGFVQLQVISPIVTATCVIKNSEVSKVKTEEFQQALVMMRQWGTRKDMPPVLVERFDIATLPNEGDSVQWLGHVTVGRSPKQTLNVEVTLLGQQEVDGIRGRWIKIDVDSRYSGTSIENKETAYVLIDEAAYKKEEFRMLQGWLCVQSTGNHVFAIPLDMNLDTMIDERIAVLDSPGLKVLGCPEVLSMLFHAEFQPSSLISSLRDEIGVMAGNNMRRVTYSEKTLKSGQLIKTQIWEPPANTGVAYQFVRSKDIPFGLVDVKLTTLSEPRVDINFNVQSHKIAAQGEVPFMNQMANAFLEQDLSRAAEGTQAQVHEALKKPNWRVWEWEHQNKVFKVYAEFCGVLCQNGEKGTDSQGNQGNVLLRNRAGKSMQIPLAQLSSEDTTYIEQGRFWPTAQSKNKQFHLSKLDYPKLTLRTIDKRVPHTFYASALGDEDKLWVLHLHNTQYTAQAAFHSLQDVSSFADYVR